VKPVPVTWTVLTVTLEPDAVSVTFWVALEPTATGGKLTVAELELSCPAAGEEFVGGVDVEELPAVVPEQPAVKTIRAKAVRKIQASLRAR
jgi:hypothetical protein